MDLNLSYNSLSGPIPSALGHLSSLKLDSNGLNGSIPHEITGFTQLHRLSLSSNLLVGQLPITIGGLFNLESLDLSNNNFSGLIPSGIQNCSRLYELNLSHNSLSGSIPQGIGDFPYPQWLDLSFNNLEGEIPISLQKKSLPEQFRGNKGLCGSLSGFPSCTSSNSSHALSYLLIKHRYPLPLLLFQFVFENCFYTKLILTINYTKLMRLFLIDSNGKLVDDIVDQFWVYSSYVMKNFDMRFFSGETEGNMFCIF
ncbi:hypothetical protein Ddye_010559 [Dipteronia dyeriana]|uniref:Uncharacterized protein n=1 Tax=Dipteronia dyeriana TaxID=168575 RepID=A0AAE0CNC9_9ROSI|nr:hypothetical protein Ddye_010559 [Dipteronia dyeriana]